MANESKWRGIPDISSFDSLAGLNKHMSVEQLQANYPTVPYLEKVNYDATQSKFYDQFNDLSLRPDAKPKQMIDIKLRKDELNLFKKNGFVVRKPTCDQFSYEYLTLFNNDLPVFITTDSILHALSCSYEKVMSEIEQSYFAVTLEKITSGMQGRLRALFNELDETGPLRECCKYADCFLTTLLSLLNSSTSEPVFESTNVYPIIEAIHACKMTEIDFCGKKKTIDFSKYRPTARYEFNLQHYFRAMMWCSLGFELGGSEINSKEFGTAIILYLLLTEDKYTLSQKSNEDSASEENLGDFFQASKDANLQVLWSEFNSLLEMFVGYSNCINFLQLGNMLHSTLKFKSVNGINNMDSLSKLHAAIVQESELKREYNAEDGNSRMFSVMGRRFTIDNWATSKLTGKSMQDAGHIRRRTSGIDVAFSVLGNNATIPIITERINNAEAENFRDGVPIQAPLSAVREVIDHFPKSVWETSMYMNWLDVLRSLSEPFDERAPQAVRTQAYSMKMLNTQLASWAQLRHDNCLYVDEDEDDYFSCLYPDTYVEPIPKFWSSMETLTSRLASSISLVPFPTEKVKTRWETINPKERQQRVVKFFERFSQHMGQLKEIAYSQLVSNEISQQQSVFLKGLIRSNELMCGLGEVDGWFYDLYYIPTGADFEMDSKVTGVFSAKPEEAIDDPGSVLHVGTGSHNLMLICVERGNEVTTFAGPVFNYKEIQTPFGMRIYDTDWPQLEKSVAPPDWAKFYQEQSQIPEDKFYRDLEKLQRKHVHKQTVAPKVASSEYIPDKNEEVDADMGISLFD